ncbi:hypothetical protein BDN67DRAFT_960783 [Paxillus ammoniavirescens]|nr:hypothetical protein BDN67DRAFT_960783 [Paxillus ammoniavirescens]
MLFWLPVTWKQSATSTSSCKASRQKPHGGISVLSVLLRAATRAQAQVELAKREILCVRVNSWLPHGPLSLSNSSMRCTGGMLGMVSPLVCAISRAPCGLFSRTYRVSLRA